MKTVVNLRCTVDEKMSWTGKAAEAGRSLSDFIRDILNGKVLVTGEEPIRGAWVCKCSTRNEAGAEFCARCGRSVKWGRPAPVEDGEEEEN